MAGISTSRASSASRSQPRFAIGQRAVLMRTAHGNVLWDCISMLDDATVSLIKALGGIQAMAISHPHFYTTMNEWAEAFDVPVHVHADDREWIMRPGAAHPSTGTARRSNSRPT